MLEHVQKHQRAELIAKATELYKSGAEPSEDLDIKPNRAQIRQLQRAAGNRGTKTAAKNPERHVRRLQTGGAKIRRAVLIDELLGSAKERVEHPVRSRMKRGRR